jgi:hypothetical protein
MLIAASMSVGASDDDEYGFMLLHSSATKKVPVGSISNSFDPQPFVLLLLCRNPDILNCLWLYLVMLSVTGQ